MKLKLKALKIVNWLFPKLYSERRRRNLTRWESFKVRLNLRKRKSMD